MAYFYGPASSQKLLQITFFKHFLSEFRILQTGDLISLPCSIHAGNQGGQSGAFLLCTAVPDISIPGPHGFVYRNQ